MKEGIHPNYKPTTIRCACGNVIETGSTKQNITVEICSKCHPFFTGKQKLVDTSGRVDKFNEQLEPRNAADDQQHAEDLRQVQLFLEEQHAEHRGPHNAHPGPHRVGRAKRQLLERERQKHRACHIADRREHRGERPGKALRELHRDRPGDLQPPPARNSIIHSIFLSSYVINNNLKC